MKKSVNNNLSILKDLTYTDFKLKYNRSILGFLWSLIKPLLMLITLYLVFHHLIKIETPHYELFLLLGLVLWGFFTEATSYSMNAILRSSTMIKKTVFEKKLIIISSNLSSLISLFLNLIVFFIFIVIFGIGISWHIIIFMILLVELFLFTLGLGFILSSLYVRFRDLKHIWEVLIQIGFWITPITYPLKLVPDNLKNIYLLNPLARIIEDSRNLLIYHTMPIINAGYIKHVLITLIICIGTLIIGFILFNKKSKKFAEHI